MVIYLDSDYRCHTTDDGSLKMAETDHFDDKCTAYIEGFRMIPKGESWTRSDGKIFHGEMISAWRPFAELDSAQREYEKEQLQDMENALAVLLGGETV